MLENAPIFAGFGGLTFETASLIVVTRLCGALMAPRWVSVIRDGECEMAKRKGNGMGIGNGNGDNMVNTVQNGEQNMSEQQIETPATTTTTTETATTTEAKQKGKRKIVPLAADDPRIPEAFRALVTDGDVIASMDEVSAEKKEKNGTKSEATAPYVRLRARTPDAAMLLSGNRLLNDADDNGDDTDADDDAEKGRGMLDHFNYAFDLWVRAKVRNELLKSLEGPEKAIERGVKGLLATGLDRDEALDIVIASMKKKGKLPADYEYVG